jgi:hypothetical protein
MKDTTAVLDILTCIEKRVENLSLSWATDGASAMVGSKS